MKILRELSAIKAACRDAGRHGRLGLVPTMGALHEGHLSLVRRACDECDQVAVSVFVNPLQFGDRQDLERYPRQLEEDAALLADAGAHIVAALQEHEMYPAGFSTTVTQGSQLTRSLEGAARPGHFDGVLTVVAKLFSIAGPCTAYFGQKDFQQTVVVRRLIDDLDLPVHFTVCDIRRDHDGLALSSRNAFLSADDRRRGLSLVTALRAAEQLFDQGETSREVLEGAMHKILCEALGQAPDYAAIVDPLDLSQRPTVKRGDVAVLAGQVGPVRLLDNHVLGAFLVLPQSAP
ncbi:MAG: pantoate--beta-alanine ligase [Pseudohongiellaceae bacterium]|jgi:pantoate--beta-alanine ligase